MSAAQPAGCSSPCSWRRWPPCTSRWATTWPASSRRAKHWRVEKLGLPAPSGWTPTASSAGRPTCAACWPSPSSACCCSTCCSGCRRWLPLDNGMASGRAGLGVEHRGQLRDQHELAGLQRRVDHGPPGADGRAGGAELRLRRGRASRSRSPLVRGFARTRTDRLGNFWVDLTRAVTRCCCRSRSSARSSWCSAVWCRTSPPAPTRTTLAGATQFLPGGPVASQEAIKELGTNGGGFFNANSAHPFEGPTAWVSLFQIFLILLIPFALPRTFGRMVGDKRQGYAILGVMATLAAVSLALVSWFQARRRRHRDAAGRGGDGGPGGPLRRTAVRAVRRGDHADLHRGDQLAARQLHAARRRRGAAQHDAGRGRARRGRLRASTGCSCSPSSPCSSPASWSGGRRSTSARGWAGAR